MINAKTAMWINIAIGVLAAIVGGGVSIFPDYVPPAIALGVVQTAAFTLVVYAGVNGALHGYSSAQQGPLVSAAPAAGTIAKTLLLFAVLGASLLIGGPRAHAGPIDSLLALPHDDLTRAIARANKATPVDDPAVKCFGKVDAVVTQFTADVATQGAAAALPLTLHPFDDFEKFWLAREGALALKADVNCQAVCSRWGQISPLLAKVKFSLCDLLNAVR